MRAANAECNAPTTSMRELAALPESQTPASTRGLREGPQVGPPRPPALHANGSHKDTSGRPRSAQENRVAPLPDHCRVSTKIQEIRSSSARRQYGARNRLDRCGSNHLDKNQLPDCGSSSAALHPERLLAPDIIARGVTPTTPGAPNFASSSKTPRGYVRQAVDNRGQKGPRYVILMLIVPLTKLSLPRIKSIRVGRPLS